MERLTYYSKLLGLDEKLLNADQGSRFYFEIEQKFKKYFEVLDYPYCKLKENH